MRWENHPNGFMFCSHLMALEGNIYFYYKLQWRFLINQCLHFSMNSNQGSKTKDFSPSDLCLAVPSHHLELGGNAHSFPSLSDPGLGAMGGPEAPCSSSSIRMEGYICCLHESYKTRKPYLITAVISYYWHFTCCFKSTSQILFRSDPMRGTNGR